VDLLPILALGLVAGTLGGIVGFGSSVILMPALVLAYGPRAAVPIMAIAAILANLSRILVWWREVDWRICAAYAVTGVPAAVLGARTLLVLPPASVEIALGVFFIAMIPVRRVMAARAFRVRPWQMAVAGALVGYLTGIVASTGPLTVPIFLATGLVKGAFLATEAAASLAVYGAKAIAFRTFGALPLDLVAQGVVVGTSLMAGSVLGKRVVLRLDARHFLVLMDGVLLLSGLAMLWLALRRS
jgi:uncharacterized membrane protein YfcA